MKAEYLDFELEIGPGQGREYPVEVMRSPAGEVRSIMHFPFDELQLESRLDKVQIALLRSGGKRRVALSEEQQAVQDFGRALFDALMTGDVRSKYDVSTTLAGHKGLRIKLRISDPALAALPWEFLYDPRRAEFVSLSTHTPIVRYLELPQPVQPLIVELPLRILGMAASPNDLVELDVQQEKDRVERALAGLRNGGLVELEWLPRPTWRELQRALRSGPWHIFHFIGHGGFDASADEGLIVVCDEQGKAERLSATVLGRFLGNHRPLRLVVLNACETARGSDQDVFSSTASILVRAGLPAVLAMQYEITDPAAVELSRVFYEALADGLPVDTAVAEARIAVSVALKGSVEWGTPVLTMRSPDGVLFELSRQPNAPSLPPTPPELVQEPEIQVQVRPSVLPSKAPGKGVDVHAEAVSISDPLTMNFVRVPAGEFLMGSDSANAVHPNETPQHTLWLDTFYIGKYPVTNAQYAVFVNATRGKAPQHWNRGAIPRGEADYPVVNVRWKDALAFCRWLARTTGKSFGLPTEAEWEKAASWDHIEQKKRIWPWGDVFDSNKCATLEGIIERTQSTRHVGQYPEGASSCGALDMAGNVWEWTSSLYRDYQYIAADGRENLNSGGARVERGGSYSGYGVLARCAYRSWRNPSERSPVTGFRVRLTSA